MNNALFYSLGFQHSFFQALKISVLHRLVEYTQRQKAWVCFIALTNRYPNGRDKAQYTFTTIISHLDVNRQAAQGGSRYRGNPPMYCLDQRGAHKARYAKSKELMIDSA